MSETELQVLSVPELRTYLREKKGIRETWIAGAKKPELITCILTGERPVNMVNACVNGSGNLASVIAESIQSYLNIRPELDEERVKELCNSTIEKALTENLIKDAIKKYLVKTIEVKNLGNGKSQNVGLQHKDFHSLLSLARAHVNVLIVGPAGSGKSFLVESIAKALDLPFSYLPVGPQTSKSDLLGYMDANGKYVPSALRKAYDFGGIFLLDEMDAGNASVLTVINNMTSNGYGSFPDGMVKKHENFIMFAAANTFGRGGDMEYIGRNRLDAATLNRFFTHYMDYDEKLEIAVSHDELWTLHVQKIRKIAAELREKIVVSPRASIAGGKLIASGFNDWKALENGLIWQGVSDEVKTRIKARM